MPIAPIVLQRRLVEVGRIRLGRKVPMSGGKSRPAKLDKFRLTSRDKARLDAAAALYGGEVTEWEGQWELVTDAEIIPIVVVPGQALSQNFELWGQQTVNGQKTPVICLRRCDGITEAISGEACLCNQQPEQTCKPTTRLSVILTEVPGLGVWRLESHGWNAATELAGTVQLLEALVATGRPVRARLRLDKREVKRASGTNKFVVPVVDIDHTMGQVLDSIGAGAPAAPAVAALPVPAAQFTPVPAELEGPAPSIAAQAAAVGEPRARSARAGAQVPMKSTGVRPRTAAEVSGSGTASDGDGQAADASLAAQSPASGEGSANATEGATLPDAHDDDVDAKKRAQQVAIWCNEAGFNDDERHAFLAAFSEGRYASAKQVPVDDLHSLRATIVRYRRGELELVDGRLREANTGLPSTDPGGQAAGRRDGVVNPDDDGPVTPELLPNWNAMRVADLAAACRERGIEPAGTKAELIALLEAAA